MLLILIWSPHVVDRLPVAAAGWPRMAIDPHVTSFNRQAGVATRE